MPEVVEPDPVHLRGLTGRIPHVAEPVPGERHRHGAIDPSVERGLHRQHPFLRDHPYRLEPGYVACAMEEDLKRVHSLRHDTDALTRFMISNPTCFFTSSDRGRSEVYFEGYAGTGYVRFHAAGRPTLLYTYEGALR